MARGRVSLSGGFSPRFFMEFCSRGGGVCLAQRCPDRLEGVRALGRGTGAQAGPCRGRTFRSRRGGRGRRPGPARSFGGLGAVSGGAGAAERTSTDEQTSGGTWRKERSAALERKTGEARRIRQRAQPAVSGLSDGGAPGACDGQCIPCDEKFSPPCLKCRTREDEAPDGAAGGLLRAGLSACFAGASGMAVFRAHGPVCGAVFVFFIKESGRSILRLRRRVRPCEELERSGGAGEIGEAGRSAALVFRQAPVRASEKRCCPRFWHEKRDGPQQVRPRKFLLQDRITSSCPCCSA